MVWKIGPAEGTWFPGRKPRGHEPKHPTPKVEKPTDTSKPKRKRSDPGPNWGGNLDIDV